MIKQLHRTQSNEKYTIFMRKTTHLCERRTNSANGKISVFTGGRLNTVSL